MTTSFIVWEDFTDNTEFLFRRSVEFDIEKKSLGIGQFSSSCNAVCGLTVSGNNVHLVAVGVPSGNFDILYTRSTNGGATFGPVENLSDNLGNSVNPAIAVAGDNVYIVWADDSASGEFDILYTRSTDGGATFSSVENLSNDPGNSIGLVTIAALDNNVYVAWRDFTEQEIFYRRSDDGGTTFNAIVNLSNNSGGSAAPVLAVSGNNVYVIWIDNIFGNNQVLYRRSTDGGVTFEETINLSNSPGNSGLATMATSGVNVYVMWEDDATGNVEILYRRSTDGGSTFSQTENLSSNPGNSQNPSVSASENNVYLVWEDSTLGNDEVLYRKSPNNGADFGPTENLSNNIGESSNPRVAASTIP
jgi:ethanolamine utilization microcompartment shell protein EutL